MKWKNRKMLPTKSNKHSLLIPHSFDFEMRAHINNRTNETLNNPKSRFSCWTALRVQCSCSSFLYIFLSSPMVSVAVFVSFSFICFSCFFFCCFARSLLFRYIFISNRINTQAAWDVFTFVTEENSKQISFLEQISIKKSELVCFRWLTRSIASGKGQIQLPFGGFCVDLAQCLLIEIDTSRWPQKLKMLLNLRRTQN